MSNLSTLDLSEKIVIFTTLGCPFCNKLKIYFKSKSIRYLEIQISNYPIGFLAVDKIVDSGGQKFLPAVFSNSVYLGGFNEIFQKEPITSSLQSDSNRFNFIDSNEYKATQSEPIQHITLNTVYAQCYATMRADKQMIKIKGKSLTFKASELVSWMVSHNPHTPQRESALKLASNMKTAGFIVNYYSRENEKPFLDDSTLYQFYADQELDILNNKVTIPPALHNKVGSDIERPPTVLGLSLLSQLFHLVDLHSSEKGIDYDALEKDPNWEIWLTDILELNLITTLFNSKVNMSDRDKKCFFLQLYQILRLHLIIKSRGFPNTSAAYQNFVSTHCYCIQDLKFTLQTIASILWSGYFLKPKQVKEKKTLFGSDAQEKKTGRILAEPPSEQILVSEDYRLLFATMSVDMVSPPLLLITEKNLDFALNWATEQYCQYTKVIANAIFCPLIFSYIHKYALKSDDKLFLQWLIQFTNDEVHDKLFTLISQYETYKPVLQFKKYPWEENIISTIFSDIDPSIMDSWKKIPVDPPPNVFPDPPTYIEDDITDICQQAINATLESGSPALIISSCGLSGLPQQPFLPVQEFVKILNAKENFLVRIPDDFPSTFKFVTEINLSQNKLKTIPSCFAEMKFLESLNLSRNYISSIPNRFCSLRTLKNLWLQYNELEYLPLAFAQLRTLEEVNLSNNKLASLPFNFGEIVSLENLDVSSNLLTELPDLSTLFALEDIIASYNKLQTFECGLKGLRHLISFDLSNNQIKEIPSTVSYLVYLNELDLSNNLISTIPEEICDLLSLKEGVEGLDLSKNPITNIGEEIWQNGITSLRAHFKWDKLLPHVRASRGKPMEMINSGKNAPLKKALSVRDKRTQLLKKKTNKEFSGNFIQDIRDKHCASDSSSFFAGANEASAIESQKSNEAKKPLGLTLHLDLKNLLKPKLSRNSLSKAQLERQLIEILPEDSENLIMEASSEGTNIDDFIIEFQHFDFKPLYQRDFVGKPHSNFLAVVKNYGPVFISIMDLSSEDIKALKEEKNNSAKNMRGRSASIGAGTLLVKKLKDTNNKDKRTDKSPESRTSLLLKNSDSSSKAEISIDTPKRRDGKSAKGRTARSLSLGVESESSSASSTARYSRADSTFLPSQVSCVATDQTLQTFLRTSERDYIEYLTVDKNTKPRPKDLLRQLLENYPQFSGCAFKLINTPELTNAIVELEMRLMVKGYKFGLLYARTGQKTEEEFYLNNEEGPLFKEFKDWLGDTITLKGWNGYTAGLDAVEDRTGTHSLFTTHRDFDIMFHVSTMLPFEAGEDMIQQIARKRHLGNDIVLIVFQEGDVPRFNPTTIKSFFNHVYFVVKKDENESNQRGKTIYMVSVAYKVGVNPNIYPKLPENGFIEKTDEGRELLLTKIINSERAAYSAPGFALPYKRTKEMLMSHVLKDCVEGSSAQNDATWA